MGHQHPGPRSTQIGDLRQMSSPPRVEVKSPIRQSETLQECPGTRRLFGGEAWLSLERGDPCRGGRACGEKPRGCPWAMLS